MPAGHGTNVDLNILQKKVGRVKKLVVENKIAAAKTLLGTITTELAAVKTVVDGVTDKRDLPDSPSLDLADI